MISTNQTPSERLNNWRRVRQSSINIGELLENFANIKPSARYIDFYTPDSWPNVFEIVSEGLLCQSGITLVLASTLYHKQLITSEELIFPVISNHVSGTTGLVLQDGNNVYNFVPGEVVSKEELEKNSTIYTTHTIPTSKLFC